MSQTEDLISNLISQYKVDVLEFPDYYDFNSLSKRLLKFKRFPVPTVLRIHGSVSFVQSLSGKHSQVIKKNDDLHFNRCDYLSAVSQFSLSYVTDNFNTDNFKNLTVIYNPLESQFLKKQSVSNSKHILFLGKILETKGCFSLIRAFNIVSKHYPDWTLFLVGRGEIKSCSSLIEDHCKNKVRFLGCKTRSEVQRLIDDCSFACVPSYFENFSMAALEIMGRSRALIYTQTTSGPELITSQENGILVDPKDVFQIANAMSLLIEDERLRSTMSNNAFITIKDNFSSDVLLKNLEFYYQSLINKKQIS